MGLFSSTKEVYVSSSVYNLAGDEINRPNFLKSSLFSAVMNPYDIYLGEVITSNYLTGPGILQRSFFNYAVRNDIAGMPTLSIRNSVAINPAIVSPHIPLPAIPFFETYCQSAELTDGDFSHWAEQWILANNPTENGTDWVADYNAVDHTITIQFVDGSTSTFGAGSYDKNKQYIIARYYQSTPSETLALITGLTTLNVLVPPSTVGYTLSSSVNTGVTNFTLNQTIEVTKVYSDGSPTVVTSTPLTTNPTYNSLHHEYGRVDFVGGDGASTETSNIEKFYHQFEHRQVTVNNIGFDVVVVNDLGGGNTETITTNTSGDFLTPIYDWREDTQETVFGLILGGAQIFIYEIGTGNATLDALQSEIAPGGVPEYYPFIPIRLNNVSMLDATHATLLDESKAAYKRATKGQDLITLIEEVEANPDISDIDYAYIQWGVAVNVIEPACRRYMYEFFRNLIPYQNTSALTITALKNDALSYNSILAALSAWTIAQSDINDPLYQTAKPIIPQMSDPDTTTIRLISDHPSLGGFDNRYTWVTIEEELFTGVGKAGAVSGDIWFEDNETFSWDVESGVSTRDGISSITTTNKSISQTYLIKQTSATTYSRLNIWGMVHNNYIYDGKAVKTTLKEGIEDLEASAFIIPLHAPTVKSLGIVDFTQMATANTWVTFNSYLVVKKKWYETFLGMLLVFIAIVVISVLISPAGLAGASGILGTNAAVGASLGLTGTAAIVAGAVTNAIAAIVISQAISTVSVSIFGEKWGAIIGAIVNFAISFGVANGFDSLTLSNLMNPQTLLQFSSALANGYAGFVQADIASINADMVENQSVYDKAKADLEALMRSMGLVNDLSFNPLSLTDSVKGNASSNVGSYVPETLDEFINRTTMTGSDIVDFTLSMVNDYTELQRSLPK